MFLGWGLFHRARERNPHPGTKHFLNVTNGGQLHSVRRQKDENLPMQVHADLPPIPSDLTIILIIVFRNNYST